MKQDENLKEKFRQALISTFKVISDEFECKTEKNNTSIKDSYNFFNIESLSSRDDYMKLRACLLYTSDAADEEDRCRSRWSPYH